MNVEFVKILTPLSLSHLTGDVIDDHGGRGPPVIHRCQTVVPLLSRRVPDIKFNGGRVLYVYRFCQICS